MLKLVELDFTVIRKRLASWFVLAILLLFLVISYVATYFVVEQFPFGAEILLPGHVFEYSLSTLSSNGILTSVIMGGLFFGSPFAWGTYSTRLTQKESRTQIYWAKILAVLLLLFSWLCVGLLVAHLTSFSLGLVENSLAYGSPGFWPVLRGSLLTLLLWTTWFMVGGTLALLSRGTAMGIGAGLAYYFLESVVVFAIPGFNALVEGYRYLFLGRSTSAISNQLFTLEEFQGNATTVIQLGTGVTVVLIYLLVLLLISWARFYSMEFPE